MAATKGIKSCRHVKRLAAVLTKCQNGEEMSSDFDYGMIVGARQGGLSFSETADLLGPVFQKN